MQQLQYQEAQLRMQVVAEVASIKPQEVEILLEELVVAVQEDKRILQELMAEEQMAQTILVEEAVVNLEPVLLIYLELVEVE